MSDLDLTFICDCTGSMGSYIRSAQENIENIINKIIQFEKTDVRFALVEYRDHPPQDRTFNVRLTNFTGSLKEIKEAVDRMEADGGGDGPESVCCAFKTAVDLEWRENATKIIVWIADAPPHGLTRDHGDGFPDGCPCKNDTLIEARRCMEKDILVYAVGTEPLNYAYLRTFMRVIAHMTNGEYVSLTSAGLLADLIVNGCREEIQIKRIVENVKKELEKNDEFKTMPEEEQQKRIDKEVEEQTKDIQIDTTIVDDAFTEPLPEIPGIFFDCRDIKEFKERTQTNEDIRVQLKNGGGMNHFGAPTLGAAPRSPMPTPMCCMAPPETSMPAFSMREEMCFMAPPMGSMASPSMGFGSPITPVSAPQSVSSARRNVSEHQQMKIKSRVNNYYSSQSVNPPPKK